jgi:hypothetical protein
MAEKFPANHQLRRRNKPGTRRQTVVTLPVNPGATMSDSSIDRRTILSATLAWAAATLSGCSDNGGSGGATCPAADGGALSCGTTMTGTHMHPLTICEADVQVGSDKTYTLADGGTGHMHMLALTAYDFLYLQAGVSIMRDSTMTNSHLHTVSITCPQG